MGLAQLFFTSLPSSGERCWWEIKSLMFFNGLTETMPTYSDWACSPSSMTNLRVKGAEKGHVPRPHPLLPSGGKEAKTSGQPGAV